MNRLVFFLEPGLFFQVVAECDLQPNSQLVLRRFGSSELEAGFQVADLGESDRNARLYIEGGYSEIYLTLGAVPMHCTDWDFANRASTEILLLEGGRIRSKVLELSKLRVFSKKSQAKQNFIALTNEILSVCTGKGITTATGVHYDYIYFHPDSARQFELRFDLEAETPNFLCIPDAVV